MGGYDRRVFTDAATIGEIVREARTRAVGRGAAQLLAMTTNSALNAATFILYESVTANPNGVGGANVPVSTCDSPTVWPGASGTATANLVDEYQFTGGQTLEGEGHIVARIMDASGTVIPDGTTAYLCFTPNGRVRYQVSIPNASGFNAIANTTGSTAATAGAVTVQMSRGDFSGSSELLRTVWIPPSGATRITSQ
jgi:hypothetical protein